MKKRVPIMIIAWMLALMLSLITSTASCETLRGYDPEEGYVYVSFGRYPQTAEGEIQPILWRVLTVDDEKIYLLSEYILLARCMHANLTQYRDEFRGDFGKTDLCEYLNTVFAAEAFTQEELSMLLPMEDIGLIFIPSAEELKNREWGLGETLLGVSSPKKIRAKPGLRAWGTEWAIKNNGFDPAEYSNVKTRIEGSSRKPMPLKELRLFVYSNQWANHSPYWTRTQSQDYPNQARCIKADGGIGRIEVGRDNEGVRPGVWLNLHAFQIQKGEGTKEDPYIIGTREQ